MGDTQFLSGKVTGKREEDGTTSSTSSCTWSTSATPRRRTARRRSRCRHATAGLPISPQVPTDLERKAAEMFARHNELAAQRRR